MNRRDLLSKTAGLPLLSIGVAALAEPASDKRPLPIGRTRRRVRPSDPAWPNSASWDRLNLEVGGHLIKVQPLFAACVAELQGAECREVLKQANNPFYLGDQPAGTQVPEFFGYSEGTIKAKSDAAFQRLIARFVGFYHDSLFNPYWGESVKIKPDNTLELSLVCQGLDNEQAADVWKPFFDWAKNSNEYSASDLDAGSGHARAWWDVEARKKRWEVELHF